MSHITRASETVPKAENAWVKISSLTSLERSPTKIWKWPEVSSLLAELAWYAQLTRISCDGVVRKHNPVDPATRLQQNLVLPIGERGVR